MTGALADTDYANLRGAYSYLGVDALTTQQELFLLSHLRGMSVKAAAASAGMAYTTGLKLMKRDDIGVIIDFLRDQMLADVRISVIELNNMALEAHRKSATATEELKAVEVLAKLNQVGGFAPPAVLKAREEKKEKDITPSSSKELERMDEGKLLHLANFPGMESLDPEPVQRDPEPVVRGDDPQEEEGSGGPITIEGELVDEDN